MLGKFTKLLLFFGLTFTNLVVFASAITIGYSSGEGGESVSLSAAYNLDDSTSLEGSITSNGASISQDQKSKWIR